MPKEKEKIIKQYGITCHKCPVSKFTNVLTKHGICVDCKPEDSQIIYTGKGYYIRNKYGKYVPSIEK